MLHILTVHGFEKGLAAILSSWPRTERAGPLCRMRALGEKGRTAKELASSASTFCTDAAWSLRNF